ncbi:MAG: DUF72 domain-containing protein [Candidatus Eisenbacteria bacterium]
MLRFDLAGLPPGLHLGTSSFGNADWVGPFYPEGAKAADFLRHYSALLPAVEIDATWYASPSAKLVDGWARKTPDGFKIAAKVPKRITHDLYLENCEGEWAAFLSAMDRLGEKRGPLLFQFPYVAKGRDEHEYRTGDDFRRRLERFAPHLAEAGRCAVEVRNRTWLGEELYSLLREAGAALVLADYYTMPPPEGYFEAGDPRTADFAYLRFLGHHRQMDKLVREAKEAGERKGDWESILVDRTGPTRAWIAVIRNLLQTGGDVFAFFNNHYAGFAPGSIDLFLRLWAEDREGA